LDVDTSIAELIKAKTEADEFLSSLECEQELLSGMGTEKINSHIENLCGKKANLNIVLRLLLIQSEILFSMRTISIFLLVLLSNANVHLCI